MLLIVYFDMRTELPHLWFPTRRLLLATTHMPSSTWTLPLDATNLSPVSSHTHNCVSTMCFLQFTPLYSTPLFNPLDVGYHIFLNVHFILWMPSMLIIVTVDWRKLDRVFLGQHHQSRFGARYDHREQPHIGQVCTSLLQHGMRTLSADTRVWSM